MPKVRGCMNIVTFSKVLVYFLIIDLHIYSRISSGN